MIKVDSNAAELFFCQYLSSLNVEFERQRLDVGEDQHDEGEGGGAEGPNLAPFQVVDDAVACHARRPY